jgi:hypothetical protein
MLDKLPLLLRSDKEPPPQWLLADDGAAPRKLIKVLLARKFLVTKIIHTQTMLASYYAIGCCET